MNGIVSYPSTMSLPNRSKADWTTVSSQGEHRRRNRELRIDSAFSVFLVNGNDVIRFESCLFTRIKIHDSSVEQANLGLQQPSDVLA